MDFLQVTGFLLTAFFISIGYNEYKTGDRSLPASSGTHLKCIPSPIFIRKKYIFIVRKQASWQPLLDFLNFCVIFDQPNIEMQNYIVSPAPNKCTVLALK